METKKESWSRKALVEKKERAKELVLEGASKAGSKMKGYAIDFKTRHDYAFGEKLAVQGVYKRIGQDLTIKLVYKEKANEVRELADELMSLGLKPELKDSIIGIQVGRALTCLDELLTYVASNHLLTSPRYGNELITEIQRVMPQSKHAYKKGKEKDLIDMIL